MYFFIIWILVVCGFLIFSYYLANQRIKNYNRIFSEVSKEFNLQFIKGSVFYFPKIYGKIDNYNISVEKVARSKQHYLEFVIKYKLNIIGDMGISKESAFSTIKKAFGQHDILIGDNNFDGEMWITAYNTYYLVAYLNKELREQIIQLAVNSSEFEMSKDRISVISILSTFGKSETITAIIKTMLSIVKDLTKDTSFKKRLMDNIISEVIEDVRLNNLQTLISKFPIDDEIRSFLSSLLNDKSIVIQVQAAKNLRDEGMKHLMNMLLSRIPMKDDMKIEIIKTLNDNEYKSSAQALKGLYSVTIKKSIFIEILKAFTQFQDESLNSFLLDQLEHDDSDIRIHVIEALGTCGQVNAVEKLYKIGKGSMNPFIRNAVQKSISQIQSRLGGVEKGWLSIPELSDMDGALTVSDNAGEGSLSIQDKNDDKV